MTRHDEAGEARPIERLAIATFGSASLRPIAPQTLFQIMLHHQSAKWSAAMAAPSAANTNAATPLPMQALGKTYADVERPTAA